MSLANAVAEINNQGVVCLNNGELQQAKYFFRLALSWISLEFNPSSVSSYGSGRTLKEFRPIPSSIEQDLLAQHECSAKHPQGHSVDFDLLYHQPIKMISEHGGSFSTDPFVDSNVCLSIILFNLALQSHLQGMASASQECLFKANILYHKSWYIMGNIIDEHETETISTGMGQRPCSSLSTGNLLVDLLSMAIWNNLAHISLQYHDFKGCENRISQLAYRANLIRRSLTEHCYYRHGSSQLVEFLSQQTRRFLLNVISYRLYPTDTAAAA